MPKVSTLRIRHVASGSSIELNINFDVKSLLFTAKLPEFMHEWFRAEFKMSHVIEDLEYSKLESRLTQYYHAYNEASITEEAVIAYRIQTFTGEENEAVSVINGYRDPGLTIWFEKINKINIGGNIFYSNYPYSECKKSAGEIRFGGKTMHSSEYLYSSKWKDCKFITHTPESELFLTNVKAEVIRMAGLVKRFFGESGEDFVNSLQSMSGPKILASSMRHEPDGEAKEGPL